MFEHRMLITPIAAACLLAGMSLTARAEVVASPVRALALLTEARVAAAKCGWLDEARRGELASYAARAELVAARRAGAAAAKQAIARGSARGRAGCTDERRELTLAVLHGAREATRATSTARRNAVRPPASAARKPSRRQARSPARRRGDAMLQRAAYRPAARLATAPAASMSDVERYRRLAAAYYQALKCRDRSHGELTSMWRAVRDLHFAILRSGRKQALARAKQAARRAGMARACR